MYFHGYSHTKVNDPPPPHTKKRQKKKCRFIIFFCCIYFQARLPSFQPNVSPDEMPEQLEQVEDIQWCPQVLVDTDLVMYLRAARLVQYIMYSSMRSKYNTRRGPSVVSSSPRRYRPCYVPQSRQVCTIHYVQ